MNGFRRWMGGRRVAAGIDVGCDAVRVAFVSRRGGTIGIERLDMEPFAVPHDVTGGDWSAVPRALEALVSRAGARLPLRAIGAVMALRDDELAISALEAGSLDAAAFEAAALESAALAQAEHATGLARESLAVDWRVEREAGVPRVMVAAVPQARVDLRVDAAAAAGIGLTAIDGEPPAALRAIRQLAAIEIASDEPYLAVWLGPTGMHAWRVAASLVVARARCPWPAQAQLADALRELAGQGEVPRCVLVGGEGGQGAPGLDVLPGGAHLALADIGDLLGCIAMPFECAAYCREAAAGDAVRHAPGFAVAFGLGLRGVYE